MAASLPPPGSTPPSQPSDPPRRNPRRLRFSLSERVRTVRIPRRELTQLAVILGLSLTFALFGVPPLVAWARRHLTPPAVQTVAAPLPPAMRQPELARLPALPDTTVLKAQAAKTAHLLKFPQEAASLWNALDPDTVAWARELLSVDLHNPPLPLGTEALALLRRQVPIGTTVLAEGQLVDFVETVMAGAAADGSDEPWLRLTVRLTVPTAATNDPAKTANYYLHVIAPRPAALTADGQLDFNPGLEVRLVGRYLGLHNLPSLTGEAQAIPVLAASGVHRPPPSDQTSSLRTATLQLPGVDPSVASDDKLLDEIDDDQPLVELRPYYHLLGKVYHEASQTRNPYPQAEDADRYCLEMHVKPQEFRGKPYLLSGKVWDAWEDRQVAADRPFNLQRVLRIRFWKDVYGVPMTELGPDGKVQSVTKALMTAYEVAVIVGPDQPLPQRGDLIHCTGRFFKRIGYALSLTGSGPRQSDTSWFRLFVAPSFKTGAISPTYDGLVVGISSAVLVLSFIGTLFYWSVRDRRLAAQRTARHRPPQASS